MTPSSAFSSVRSFLSSFPFRHRQLFLLVGACLGGHVSATWEWFSVSAWLVCGCALLVGCLWHQYGRTVALSTLCLLLVFGVAHTALRRALSPQFPVHHLHQLALPQEVTIEGWLSASWTTLPRDSASLERWYALPSDRKDLTHCSFSYRFVALR
jgi:hypothetical protein